MKKKKMMMKKKRSCYMKIGSLLMKNELRRVLFRVSVQKKKKKMDEEGEKINTVEIFLLDVVGERKSVGEGEEVAEL